MYRLFRRILGFSFDFRKFRVIWELHRGFMGLFRGMERKWKLPF